MQYASRVQKGTIFERRDRNGNIWRATVTRRTALYVYITIENPYDGSVDDYYGMRVQICQKYKGVQKKVVDFWGDEQVIVKQEPIDDYYIIVHQGSQYGNVFHLAR